MLDSHKNIFVYSLCPSFWGFVFCFFVWEFAVCLFACFLLMATVNRRGHFATRSISLRMHGVQSVAFIIGFIYGQSIFFQIM